MSKHGTKCFINLRITVGSLFRCCLLSKVGWTMKKPYNYSFHHMRVDKKTHTTQYQANSCCW